MICNRSGIGDLCIECNHNKQHDRNRYCNYSKCLIYAIDFANKNKNCNECIYQNDCSEYTKLFDSNQPVINLLTKGDDCSQYRRRIIYAKCQ